MDCSAARSHFISFVDDLLEEDDYQVFHQHLASCPACSSHIHSFGCFSNDFSELANVELPDAVEMAEEVIAHLAAKRQKNRRSLQRLGIIFSALILFCGGIFLAKQFGMNIKSRLVVTQTEKSQGPETKKKPLPKKTISPRGKVGGQREAEELEKIKEKIRREKEEREKINGLKSVPLTYDFDPAKNQTQVQPDLDFFGGAFSGTAAGQAQRPASAATASFHWHVALPDVKERTKLRERLRQLALYFEYDSEELIVFILPASKWEDLVKESAGIATWQEELRKIPVESDQKKPFFKISLWFEGVHPDKKVSGE